MKTILLENESESEDGKPGRKKYRDFVLYDQARGLSAAIEYEVSPEGKKLNKPGKPGPIILFGEVAILGGKK